MIFLFLMVGVFFFFGGGSVKSLGSQLGLFTPLEKYRSFSDIDDSCVYVRLKLLISQICMCCFFLMLLKV